MLSMVRACLAEVLDKIDITTTYLSLRQAVFEKLLYHIQAGEVKYTEQSFQEAFDAAILEFFRNGRLHLVS